jgi:hypothetical protein
MCWIQASHALSRSVRGKGTTLLQFQRLYGRVAANGGGGIVLSAAGSRRGWRKNMKLLPEIEKVRMPQAASPSWQVQIPVVFCMSPVYLIWENYHDLQKYYVVSDTSYICAEKITKHFRKTAKLILSSWRRRHTGTLRVSIFAQSVVDTEVADLKWLPCSTGLTFTYDQFSTPGLSIW